MDFDYDEEYVGEGLFGKSKYKNKYYFSDFNDAAKRFIDDLTWAIDYMSSDIEDGAVDNINLVYKTVEENIKKEFAKKIDELSKLV